jgi:hypothetical protein
MKVVKFASTAKSPIMAITGVPLPPPLPRSYPAEDEQIGRLSTFALDTCAGSTTTASGRTERTFPKVLVLEARCFDRLLKIDNVTKRRVQKNSGVS